MNKKIKLAGAGVIVLAALTGGFGVGMVAADPTKTEEYAAISAENAKQSSELSEQEQQVSTLKDKQKKLQEQLDDALARESDLKAKETAVTERETAVGEAEAALKKREDAVKGAEAKKAATTITEGTWTVGRNIEPGTYTTEKPISGRCYWGIYASGTNGDDIIANDNVSGGQPTVTLQVGQDFETSRCGSWSKIG